MDGETGWAPFPVELRQLADAYGVATQYWDQAGESVEVGRATVEAVLTALGLDITSTESIGAALESKRLRDWRRMLPPVFVMRQGSDQRLWAHVSHGAPIQAIVTTEDGAVIDLAQMDYWVEPVEVDGVLVGEASFRVPGDLPLGWHVVTARSGEQQASAPVVVAPARLDPQSLAGDRQWGFMTQVYAMRSRDSWGLGDIHDLGTLATWSGRDLGAGFVLINPLHAASPKAPMSPSPYLPVTRRFANPMYLRVEDVPEFDTVSDIIRDRISELGGELRKRNERDELLDRDAVWSAKRVALLTLFRLGMSPVRRALFDQFVHEQGQGLVDFATWCAITESSDEWPSEFDHPRSEAVARFREDNARAVEFHMWMQWLIDEQLAVAQRDARQAGMAIGIMHDLAVGVHPEGSDAWALQDVLVRGVSVGAPPDMYNQMGQDWSQPPWHPDALAEAAFIPFRDMLRTVLHHAGGLRIDHVLGLFRLWWVPQGMPAYAGTFVRFDYDAMLSILMLEAHRHGCIVVGEDLGTVEPWVQEVLAERGILGTSILWFESADGAIRDPGSWRREVLASVTVHDLPPTAGYLRDEHVRIRAELGLLTVPVDDERANADRERTAWANLLKSHGWLANDVDITTDDGLADMAVALHRAAAASPARLLGIGLPDAVGDRRAQNQPGTDQEYPNWRVPMADGEGDVVLLDDLIVSHPFLDRLLGTL